jgi:hypothetical protein
MAKIGQNDLTLGLRGRFGKQFQFRRYRNQTIALRHYEIRQRNTDAQLAHRAKFRLAAQYAKGCLLVPELKAEYEKYGSAIESTAFAAAVKDFLTPIEIQDVLTASYDGQAGFPITIVVKDVFKVKSMLVTITDDDGNVVESGEASEVPGSPGFSYITKVSIPDVAGHTIKVEATDRPGKTVMNQVTF